jgi:hypothetical protein
MFWIHDCRSWQGSNVAATYDRSVIVVYVNGVANGSKSVPGGITDIRRVL